MIDELKQKISNVIKAVKSKDSFIQNFAITFTGSFFSILIQLLLTPIIARIYPPEAYGTFSLFNAIVSNLALIGTLTYVRALLLPKTHRDFIHLAQLVIFLSFVFSAVVTGITLLFGRELQVLLNLENLGNWIYAIGPAVLLLTMGQLVGEWNARSKRFRKRSITEVSSALGIRLFHIAYGLSLLGNFQGLIIGEYLGKTCVTLSLFIDVADRRSKKLLRFFKKYQLLKIARNFKNYPLYFLPGSWMNLLSEQLPVYFFTYFYDVKHVGYFALATGLLAIPMRLLGNAVQPVFFQKAVETFNNNRQDLGRITYSLYRQLLFLGVIPFSILTVFGDVIFSVFLGKSWTLAGVYASYLGYYYIFRLISSPLSTLFSIYGREKKLLYFQLFLLIIRLLALLLGIYVFRTPEYTLLAFSIANTIAYFLLSLQIFRMVSVSLWRVLVFTVLFIGPTFLFFLLLRQIILGNLF